MQPLMFDPGGFKGILRAWPFLGERGARCFVRKFSFWAGVDLKRFLTEGGPRNIIFRSEVQETLHILGSTTVFFAARQV